MKIQQLHDSLRIDFLETQLAQIKYGLDSIKKSTELNQLQYELNQKQDVISQVNEFYDSAWLKLIIVISVLGILFPLIAQYFQRKNLKELSEFIQNQMNESFENKIDELKNFNQIEMNSKLQEFKENLRSVELENKNLLNELDASTYYLQGRTGLNGGQYHQAIASYLKSAHCWLLSSRPERARVIFVNLKICLEQTPNKSFLARGNNLLKNGSLKMTILEIFKYFENHDFKDLYLDKLEEVKKEFERINNGG